jgi:1,2-phenylacetyl-CoA epoxidase catalytic subunit
MTNLAHNKNVCISSYDWVEYFYQNAPEPILPWGDGVRLSGAEKRAVIASIQQFQLGEGASGARMLERAQRFSRETGDLGLIAALKLFLREEQRHSNTLARFLQLENASSLRKHWVHSVFRWLRGIASLELCLKVLVTAEVLARPYYAALRDATGSPLLRSICQRIFEEEGAHLRFQAFALSRFQNRHRRLTQALIKMSHVVLLACTAALVWAEHQTVFKSAGRTFRQFWEETWVEFDSLYRAASLHGVRAMS